MGKRAGGDIGGDSSGSSRFHESAWIDQGPVHCHTIGDDASVSVHSRPGYKLSDLSRWTVYYNWYDEGLLTDEAWTEFGYKDGNFYWFNEWWQTEAPGMTKGPFRLVSVTWTLIEHTEAYDRLGFTMVLERRCARSKKAHVLLGIVESD